MSDSSDGDGPSGESGAAPEFITASSVTKTVEQLLTGAFSGLVVAAGVSYHHTIIHHIGTMVKIKAVKIKYSTVSPSEGMQLRTLYPWQQKSEKDGAHQHTYKLSIPKRIM